MKRKLSEKKKVKLKEKRKNELKKEYIRLLMLMLRTRYRFHKFCYYELSKPKISDHKFDMLEKKFEKVCEHIQRFYPDLDHIYQPRTWVGYDYKHRGA